MRPKNRKSRPASKKKETPMREELLGALSDAGIGSGDIVFVHSDVAPVIAAGNIFKSRETLSILTECFLEVVGKQGTLVVPAFNYDFCRGAAYSHEKSPSQVGLWSNHVLQDPRAKRSFHPIFSAAAIGANAADLTRGVSKSSFGEDSLFHRLHEQNAKLVFFNASFYYCTFIHYAEQKIGVDYRFLKTFTGSVSVSGAEKMDSFDFYACSLDRDVVLDLTRLEKELLADGRMKRSFFREAPILGVRCADVFDEAVLRVKSDPYYLLKHPPKCQTQPSS